MKKGFVKDDEAPADAGDPAASAPQEAVHAETWSARTCCGGREPKFKLLVTKLEHAEVVVSHAKAMTSKQRQARADWVAGDRDLVKGYQQLELVLDDIANGNKAAAKAAAAKAEKPTLAGLKLELKAAKLLGQLHSTSNA